MKKIDPKQFLGFGSLEDLPYDPNAPIKKDRKIKKIKGRPDDIHAIDDTGTTVGAFKNKGEWCYYVRWDKKEIAITAMGEHEMVVGIMGFKIEEIK